MRQEVKRGIKRLAWATGGIAFVMTALFVLLVRRGYERNAIFWGLLAGIGAWSLVTAVRWVIQGFLIEKKQ